MKLLVQILWRIFAPIILLIVLLFRKEVNEYYYEKYNQITEPPQDGGVPIYHLQPLVKRYKLSKLFSFAETPDDCLPGGLYEPTVLKVYEKYGSYWCSWYWLAIRNVGHRMRWDKGFEVPANFHELTVEEQSALGVIQERERFWIFELRKGFQVKRDWLNEYSTTGLWACPQFSIRWRNQDA